MKNIWRKMRDCWLDFWEDDELDMNKKHLSQHDKRSLLYGGFMIGVATFGLFSIGIIAGNIWTNHQNQKDMEEFLGTVVTYMAKAGAESINENSVNMVLANKMLMQNFQTVKGLTSNILELVDKHDSLK